MSASAAVASSSGTYNNRAYWERIWRQSGINFVVFFVIAYAVYGVQPQAGASADTINAFYAANRMRVLIASVFAGFTALNLMWFAATLRTVLADAGVDGWGAAATASSAVVGGMFLLFTALSTAVAYSIAASGSGAITSALNDFGWAALVVSCFPRAMLIMAGSFGLWRAGRISNRTFGAGVTLVILTLLGATTWMSDGVWAPDGVYSRFVVPALGLVWVLVFNRVVQTSPATRAAW